MTHIGEEQVREALTMAKAVELVEEAFRRLDDGRAVNHPRRRIQLDNRAVLHAMDAGDNVSNRFAAKLYATRPGVGARFLVALFDAETTRLLATIDADALGRIRTGAASGVASKFLAREDAAVAGMIGCGHQAETQLEAVAHVRPLREVRVFGRDRERREAFARRMSERLGIEIKAVDSAERAVREADVAITITSAREPVLRGEWLAAGCHLNAAGSNQARRREIDGTAVERAAVVACDSIEQARIECGDLVQAAAEGRFNWGRALEFSSVASGRAPGRATDDQITLFESQGLAIEDLVVAEWVYGRVR